MNNSLLQRIWKSLASLKLTVVCLTVAMLLVFIGTLGQVELGLFMAQEHFFRSFFVTWIPHHVEWHLGDPETIKDLSIILKGALVFFNLVIEVVELGVNLFAKIAQVILGEGKPVPVFPGGFLVGGVLLVNLIAAYSKKLQFNAKKSGILLIHGGVLILLLGQLGTELYQVESHMRLSEGERKNYSESSRHSELAVMVGLDDSKDRVVTFSENYLAKHPLINHPELAFTLKVIRYYPNSRLADLSRAENATPASSSGIGARLMVTEAPIAKSMDERNVPSLVAEVITDSGSQGTWLFSAFLEEPESVQVEGKTYRIGLRWQRFYTPYYIHLKDFTHEKYQGTEIPKNFASRIHLTNPLTQEERDQTIKMNSPLRYGGKTYYQAGFDERDDRVTILQVVRNPSWLVPYISCALVSLGMTLQFSMHLKNFIKRKRS